MYCTFLLGQGKYTYVVYSVYEGIIAAVAHSQPITDEVDNIDVLIPVIGVKLIN